MDDPATVSALLVDRILQFSTLIVLPLAILTMLLVPHRIASSAAIAASAVSFALGLSAVLSGFNPAVDPVSMAFAALALVIGAGGLTILLHRRLRGVRSNIKLLAPLALLPVLQFWHTTSFVPERLLPSLTMTSEVITRDTVDGVTRGVVVVHLRNDGDAAAKLLDSDLFVCPRASLDARIYEREKLAVDPNCFGEAVVGSATEVPGRSSVSTHVAFLAPLERPLVQIAAWATYGRGDRLRTAPERLPPRAGDDACTGDTRRYRLQHEAKFRGVVLQPRWLTFDRTDDGRDSWFFTAGDDDACEESEHPLAAEYGVDQWRTFNEDWIAPVSDG